MSLEQTLGFARALEWVDIGSREQVFHAARALLVSRREDLRLFGVVFDRFWLGIAEPPAERQLPLAPRDDLSPGRRFRVSYLASAARPEDPGVEVADRTATYSAEEVLRRRDFAGMTAEELVEVRRLIESTSWRMSERRTRRLVAGAGRASTCARCCATRRSTAARRCGCGASGARSSSVRSSCWPTSAVRWTATHG